jgi:DNA-directed RNA polymerase alpha subunit
MKSPGPKPSENDFPKLSNPARRALANAGIRRMTDLAQMTEADFARLHGIGPNAVATLKAAMKARGLTFENP